MGNGHVAGAITSILKKVYYSKTHVRIVSDFWRKCQATIPEYD